MATYNRLWSLLFLLLLSFSAAERTLRGGGGEAIGAAPLDIDTDLVERRAKGTKTGGGGGKKGGGGGGKKSGGKRTLKGGGGSKTPKTPKTKKGKRALKGGGGSKTPKTPKTPKGPKRG